VQMVWSYQTCLVHIKATFINNKMDLIEIDYENENWMIIFSLPMAALCLSIRYVVSL
jgi:hypothetical protein